MKAFDELENLNIQWVQPSAWKRDYELQTEDGEVLARLHLHTWNDKADLEALGNRWGFDTRGFFNRITEVTSVGTGEVYASYSHNKKTLTLHDGRTFRFKQIDFWGNKWSWVDATETPVLGFKTGGAFRYNSDIHMDAEMVEMRSMPVLVYLGWYLLIKTREAAASSTAVIAAT